MTRFRKSLERKPAAREKRGVTECWADVSVTSDKRGPNFRGNPAPREQLTTNGSRAQIKCTDRGGPGSHKKKRKNDDSIKPIAAAAAAASFLEISIEILVTSHSSFLFTFVFDSELIGALLRRLPDAPNDEQHVIAELTNQCPIEKKSS